MPASFRRQAHGEFELLAKVRAAVERGGRGRGVVIGIGDDAAVVRPSGSAALVLTTDTMVESVHFHHHWLTPPQLGVRAFRAAVSDIAAMGALPRWVLLSLEIASRSNAEQDALALVRALAAAARRTGAALVGGNVSGGPRDAVTVTVIGEAVGKPLLRRGAKAGHLVFVTGAVGGAAAGCQVLLSGPQSSTSVKDRLRDSAAIAAWRRPPLRIAFAAALARRTLASSMIDVSDGLLQDLAHIADESRVTLRIDASAVPVHRAARAGGASGPAGRVRSALELALGGGEDYELAFTAPPSARAGIERVAAAHRTPVSVIGRVEKGRPSVTDSNGNAFAVATAGFDHLRARGRRTTRSR